MCYIFEICYDWFGQVALHKNFNTSTFTKKVHYINTCLTYIGVWPFGRFESRN